MFRVWSLVITSGLCHGREGGAVKIHREHLKEKHLTKSEPELAFHHVNTVIK